MAAGPGGGARQPGGNYPLAENPITGERMMKLCGLNGYREGTECMYAGGGMRVGPGRQAVVGRGALGWAFARVMPCRT